MMPFQLTISARAKPDLKLDVQVLPPKCDDPAFVMSLNDKPGILALAMEEKDGKLEALPFIVPGARFNEKYGWDSVSLFSFMIVGADCSTLWPSVSWSMASLTWSRALLPTACSRSSTTTRS
jgi:neutral trehalase